jgi:acyl-CoA hydrolase
MTGAEKMMMINVEVDNDGGRPRPVPSPVRLISSSSGVFFFMDNLNMTLVSCAL